jgi:hypothetical protein
VRGELQLDSHCLASRANPALVVEKLMGNSIRRRCARRVYASAHILSLSRNRSRTCSRMGCVAGRYCVGTGSDPPLKIKPNKPKPDDDWDEL